jgi:site-specific recombinase
MIATSVDSYLVVSPARTVREALKTIGAASASAPVSTQPLLELLGVLRRYALPNDGMAELNRCLRDNADLRAGLCSFLGALLVAREYHTVLADVGVLAAESAAGEALQRIAHKLLPQAPRPDHLIDLLRECFSSPADAGWIEKIEFGQWAALIGHASALPRAAQAHSRRQAQVALSVLTARLASLGLTPVMLRHSSNEQLEASPFLRLSMSSAAWLQAINASDDSGVDKSPAELLRALASCEAELVRVREASREQGTSITLNHALSALANGLARLRSLVLIVSAPSHEESASLVARMLITLCLQQCHGSSLRRLAAGATRDLALQITQHGSQRGEHYVTDTAAQWRAMFRAAAGAGIIIALMAWFKLLIGAAQLPPLWATVTLGLNYGIGFVLVHVLQQTVATKQPALTAALLAARLEADTGTPLELKQMLDLVVRMVRTQVVAVAGNVVVAVPTAVILVWLAAGMFGTPLLSDAKAHALAQDLQPFTSLALPHAVLAGVCLFLAGIANGYFDNYAVYGQLAARISAHPWLNTLLGASACRRMGAYVEQHLGVLMGNMLLGLMLASVGFIGLLTGLPLDVRHVALSSANAAFAASALGTQLPWTTLALTALGVALVGVVNIGTSFWLSLVTALRARTTGGLAGLAQHRTRLLLTLLLKRMIRRPQDFLWPPRGG